MNLVQGAVGSLISKLGELLKEEYMLQKTMAEKIGSLIKELECSQAALCKVAEVPSDQLDEQVCIWACEIREASYDMEDVLDTFLVSAQGDHEQTDPKSLFERLKRKMAGVYNIAVSGPLKRRRIAVTIDDINKRLEQVTERHRRYTLDSIVAKCSPTSSVDPRLAAMYKEVTQLVGINKPSDELMSMLSPLAQGRDELKEKMKMVSVVGVGGLGKTTLAKTVYDKVKMYFKCSAFVPVGQNPDLKKVFSDVLIELDKKYINSDITILDERQLIDELRKYLEKKRYLIVLDDIWDTKSWETIKISLVEHNCGSRIITTTRKLEVAEEASDEVYKLKPLPYDKCKKLFYTRIFGAEDKCPHNQLEDESVKILKKCGGVPLAIITMASLLVGKSKEEWFEICSSIDFRDKDNKQVCDTEWILSLSYYDLPPHLKTCLLYLSAFPEDHVVDKNSLIWKWVAEGFVHKKPGTRLFEVGERYFTELINRSMIMAVESENCGVVDGCRVHDLVLDVIRLKSHEVNFVTISNNSESTSSPSNKVRRLVHQNRVLVQTHQDNQMDQTHIRSFIACRCRIIDKGLSFLSFELLRVLALEHCYNDALSDHSVGPLNQLRSLSQSRIVAKQNLSLGHLGNLIHLRYLGFRHTPITELPEGIAALKFLQTLDLTATSLEKLPSSIGKLTQLICLRAGNAIVPNGLIEKLISLEELQIHAYRDTAKQFLKYLKKLNSLEKPQISSDERGVCKEAPSIMPNLKMLEFSVNVIEVEALCYKGGWGNLGLEYFSSLQKVKVNFWCLYAFPEDVERVKAALMHLIKVHPNKPMLQSIIKDKNSIRRYSHGCIIDDSATEEFGEEVSSRPSTM